MSKEIDLLRQKELLSERQRLLTEYRGVNDPGMVREYIENKLIEETTNEDPKIRLKATELLGNITDIGAFTERKSVVFTEESDASLRERLSAILGKPIDGAIINDT